MVYKTKKNNRFKKNKNVQTRYTKKQNYYGGVGYGNGPAITHHNSDVINGVSEQVNKVGSFTSFVNAKSDALKNSTRIFKANVGKKLGDFNVGIFNGINKIAKNIVDRIGKAGLETAGKASTIIIRAASKPLEEAAGTFQKLGEDAARNAGMGAVNVATDIVGAIPGAGAIVEGAKLATDLATTANKSVQILGKGIDTVGKVVDETSKNVTTTLNTIENPLGSIKLPVPDIEGAINNKINNKINEGVNNLEKKAENVTNAVGETVGEGVNKLEKGAENVTNAVGESANNLEKSVSDKANSATDSLNNSLTPVKTRGGFKKIENVKVQIGGRISDSIAAFTDPIGYMSILKGGNNKTKRMITDKNKNAKSRRVHFSFE
jgi:hypothetical protein